MFRHEKVHMIVLNLRAVRVRPATRLQERAGPDRNFFSKDTFNIYTGNAGIHVNQSSEQVWTRKSQNPDCSNFVNDNWHVGNEEKYIK